MIAKNDFEYLNPNRANGFNGFFLWPVLLKSGNDNPKTEMVGEAMGLERLSFELSSLGSKESGRMFGTDILLRKIEENYYVAFGYFNKVSGRDYKKGEELLRNFGFSPIHIASSTLYAFAISSKDKRDYVLREYRAGAEKFQAYFKDDHYDGSERRIEERLENDWNDGIRPYRIVLHRSSSDEVSIYGNGLVLFSKFEGGLDVANAIAEIAIEDRRLLNDKVKDVRYSVVPNLPIRIVERSPLRIRVSSNKVDKEKLADKIIKHLGSRFASYGGTNNEGTYHFILQREFKRESDEQGTFLVLSSFAVNIFDGEVIVSPTSESETSDIVEIFYGVERFFRVKENWLRA
jgi:hypothetical protein